MSSKKDRSEGEEAQPDGSYGPIDGVQLTNELRCEVNERQLPLSRGAPVRERYRFKEEESEERTRL